jgi:hypothetical protein
MKNLVKKETTIILNNDSGEIEETTKTTQQFLKFEQEPSYIKLYLQDIGYLYNLPKHLPTLLFELLKLLDYDNEITINLHKKKKIAEALSVKVEHVTNSISVLTKKNILIRIERGVYTINTFLFGKGSWKDILKHRESLRLEIIYDEKNGREFKTIITK